MIKIPNTNKQWAYSTESDLFGNVVNCHNITFDKKGYATLNSKMGEMAGSDTQITAVNSFVLNGSDIHAITTDLIWKGTYSLNTDTPFYARQGGSAASAAGCNGLYWQGKTHYTDSGNVRTWDGTTNAAVITGLDSSVYHPICLIDAKNSIAVGNKNKVHIYNSSYVLDTTNLLVIPEIYTVSWVRFIRGKLYVGTFCLTNENAKVFVWNLTGAEAQDAWDAGGVWSFSGAEYDSSFVQFNSRGQLMQFTGAGFKQLAALPVYYTQQLWRSSGGYAGGHVIVDGIKADGNNIYINLLGTIVANDYESGKSAKKYLPEQPSGVWCYDPDNGLYPFALISSDSVQDLAVSSVDTSTNTLVLSSVPFKTGDKVRYNASVAIGGLNIAQNYFVIKVDSTTIKLAKTYNDAIAGTAIDLTSTGTSSRVLGYIHDDFGVAQIEQNGAIGFYKETQDVPHLIFSQYLLASGNTLKVNGSTVRKSICSLQKNENRGSFTTPKINSSAIQDNYRNFVVKFNGVQEGNDKIIIKYRDSVRKGFPYCNLNTKNDTVIWTDASTFVITSTEFGNAQVGDEVFIISGRGAGYTVHISSVTAGTGNFTVVIDEPIPNVSNGEYSNIVVDNWTKVLTITDTSETTDKGYAIFPVSTVSKWFQFKLELRGEGVQIEEIGLDQNVNKA